MKLRSSWDMFRMLRYWHESTLMERGKYTEIPYLKGWTSIYIHSPVRAYHSKRHDLCYKGRIGFWWLSMQFRLWHATSLTMLQSVQVWKKSARKCKEWQLNRQESSQTDETEVFSSNNYCFRLSRRKTFHPIARDRMHGTFDKNVCRRTSAKYQVAKNKDDHKFHIHHYPSSPAENGPSCLRVTMQRREEVATRLGAGASVLHRFAPWSWNCLFSFYGATSTQNWAGIHFGANRDLQTLTHFTGSAVTSSFPELWGMVLVNARLWRHWEVLPCCRYPY